MKISECRFEGGCLHLKTSDEDARRFAYRFKPGEFEILPAKKKRSLDANAMCWAMCEKIAKAVGMTKEDVYRKNIKECGYYTPLPIKENAVEAFARIWAGHGTGWIVDVVDDSKIPGYKLVFAYEGSSQYDTLQMSRFIDHLIQDAEALGIDTLSDREKSLLLEDWHEKSVKQKSKGV